LDIYEDCGLFEDTFENLFQKLYPSITVPRNSIEYSHKNPTALNPRSRLALILHVLQRKPTFSQVAKTFQVSKAYVSREISHLLPKLLIVLHEIQMPQNWIQNSFNNVSAAIDCTCHFRNRVHPGQADLYRGDKHAHFLTAQVIVSLQGDIYSVSLGLGHNNDQGMLILTNMKEFLINHDLFWLADAGYSFCRLITPDDSNSQYWNAKQRSLRSVVETSIGIVKNWAIAGQKTRFTLELHEIALLVVYHLTNILLKEYPLRLNV